jgi:hypothetical protein
VRGSFLLVSPTDQSRVVCVCVCILTTKIGIRRRIPSSSTLDGCVCSLFHFRKFYMCIRPLEKSLSPPSRVFQSLQISLKITAPLSYARIPHLLYNYHGYYISTFDFM